MSIEIKNLTYIYGKNLPFEKKALDNINIKIKKGEFIGIIGATGSGKSTLIQHLNGLLKPTEGTVLIDGKNINKNKKSSINKKVGLVFQYPENQLFENTIFKDVSFGPINIGIKGEKLEKCVKDALNLVNIKESDYYRSPFDLSGGEKRRVAIAGVLSMEPDILIMDEPTVGLDPKGKNEILNKIKEIHNKRNNTTILVSHSMEDVAKFSDKIIVMDEGKVILFDTPKEVFKNIEKLEKIGLALPQISYLIQSLEKKGIILNKNIYTVEEITKEIYSYFNKTTSGELK